MTVGEAFGVTLEQTPLFVDERSNELNMIFHFDLVRLDCQGWRWKPWTLPEFKAICARFNEGLDAHSWPTVYLTNHDNPRSVSHFGDDSPEYRILSQNPSVFAYTRTLEPDKYLVVLNFAKSDIVYIPLEGLKVGQLVLSNLDAKERNVSRFDLRGWEARIYKL
jgi:hypothetical protein